MTAPALALAGSVIEDTEAGSVPTAEAVAAKTPSHVSAES